MACVVTQVATILFYVNDYVLPILFMDSGVLAYDIMDQVVRGTKLQWDRVMK